MNIEKSLSESIEKGIKNGLEKSIGYRICNLCRGSGNLKAMQLGINKNGLTERVQDTTVKCKKCDGAGFTVEIRNG